MSAGRITPSPSLSRRGVLASATGLAAGVLAGCSSPVVAGITGRPPTSADVVFWHLFGGGDGENFTTMVGDVQRSAGLSVDATLLPWGNPYYTKLSLSASSGRGPDVAIAHLSRLPLLAQAGLLEPIDEEGARAAGLTEDKFTPAAWKKATIDGTPYAVPLDTHPWVLFYNVDLAKKADLLDDSGDNLVPIQGKDEFVAALQAMKKAGGGDYGALSANTTDPSTCWRFFATLYSGLAGPVVSQGGTELTLDRDACEETLAFMQSLTGELGLMPGDASPPTVNTLYASGKVGFLFEGEWQIPTYRDIKLPDGKPLDFNVVPFPAILGPDPVTYADSHAFVFVRSADRTTGRTADAMAFVKGVLEDSAVWAQGGHIPAWLPVQESEEFKKLTPQTNYVRAAFNATYDPPAWYTGAGSDFQTAVGGVIGQVLSGAMRPTTGVAQLEARLRTFTSRLSPV